MVSLMSTVSLRIYRKVMDCRALVRGRVAQQNMRGIPDREAERSVIVTVAQRPPGLARVSRTIGVIANAI